MRVTQKLWACRAAEGEEMKWLRDNAYKRLRDSYLIPLW